MDFRDYLTLAWQLANGSSEAEWRTTVSRAYYAAFHVARQLLTEFGFQVPHAERAHAYLWLRLANSGDIKTARAGNALNSLRGDRNQADYQEAPLVNQQTAFRLAQKAEDVIQALDAARLEPVRSQVTDAMKTYERDVLRTVTWHPTP